MTYYSSMPADFVHFFIAAFPIVPCHYVAKPRNYRSFVRAYLCLWMPRYRNLCHSVTLCYIYCKAPMTRNVQAYHMKVYKRKRKVHYPSIIKGFQVSGSKNKSLYTGCSRKWCMVLFFSHPPQDRDLKNIFVITDDQNEPDGVHSLTFTDIDHFQEFTIYTK